MKKALAAVLALLQLAWSFSIGSYEALAGAVVQTQIQTQTPAAGVGVAPVPMGSMIQSGGPSAQLFQPTLDNALPSVSIGADPVIRTQNPSLTSQVGVRNQAASMALTPSVISPNVRQAAVAAPAVRSRTQALMPALSKPSALARPELGRPGGERRTKTALSQAQEGVRKSLDMPGLRMDAPAEDSKSAADALFARIRGENLIRTEGSPVSVTRSLQEVAGRRGRISALEKALARSSERKALIEKAGLPQAAERSRKPLWQSPKLRAAAAALAAAGALAALPLLSSYVSVVAAAGSIALGVIGIPQIVRNFKMGREGVKDLAIGSTLIWFAGATLISIVSVGSGASIFWSGVNVAGVLESLIILGQINYHQRSKKALRATLLTVAAALSPIPLIATGLLLPHAVWMSAAFWSAMALFTVLNWPQIRQNYHLFMDEGRGPKGLSWMYSALVTFGSLLHLYAAFMGGDVQWMINAVLAIVTSSTVLSQIFLPKASNKALGPGIRTVERLLEALQRVKPNAKAELVRRAREVVAPLFKDAGLERLAGEDMDAQLDRIVGMARRLPGRSALYLEAPTSTGKSVLARHLRELLGDRIKVLEVDRYFKSVDEVVRTKNGEPDYDRPDSIHMARAAEDIRTLLAGGTIELPSHDMESGKTSFESGESMSLGPDDILIVDSIFASHDTLLDAAKGHESLNVFMYAPATVRLKRRLLRDKERRGTPPVTNLKRWGLILAREKSIIMPMHERADVFLNLTLEGEIRKLSEVYAELLAETWIKRGRTPEIAELFRRLIRASINTDKRFVMPAMPLSEPARD